ncbi:MAG: aromatic ring-hydroxylating oxygenase subunit alpha, partial [Pseudolabrys sp.]
MAEGPTQQAIEAIRRGYHPDPSRSYSLRAAAYTDAGWYQVDRQEIIARTWQWVCHVEKLRELGTYVAVSIADKPIVVIRNREGALRAFYNVCKHRAHVLLAGEGRINKITCPYHAWTYKLDGQLFRAPHTDNIQDFDPKEICLEPVQVEAFCGFIYVNLDRNAPSLSSQSGALEKEIRHWAPDIESLTFGHRLTYDIR